MSDGCATRRVLDVSALPTRAFGHRDPMWWAMVLLVAIEGTMLVLLALSYAYVRERVSPWPPSPMPRSASWIATGELVLLLLSAPMMALTTRAARRDEVATTRRRLAITTVLGIAALALRWLQLEQLPVRWDENAYGSLLWMLLGVHTLHLLTSLIENLLFVALLVRGPVEEKHFVDIDVSSLLWYFVVAGQLLLWSVVFVELFARGYA